MILVAKQHHTQLAELTSPSSCASRALLFRRSFCSAFFSPFSLWKSCERLALLPTLDGFVVIFPKSTVGDAVLVGEA